jgi:hypothetical protein
MAKKDTGKCAVSTKGNAAGFSLVPTPAVDDDTVEALEQLLDLARKGELIGVAFVGMLKRRKYFVDTAGEADRNPTFARGAVRALDDELAQSARG